MTVLYVRSVAKKYKEQLKKKAKKDNVNVSVILNKALKDFFAKKK